MGTRKAWTPWASSPTCKLGEDRSHTAMLRRVAQPVFARQEGAGYRSRTPATPHRSAPRSRPGERSTHVAIPTSRSILGARAALPLRGSVASALPVPRLRILPPNSPNWTPNFTRTLRSPYASVSNTRTEPATSPLPPVFAMGYAIEPRPSVGEKLDQFEHALSVRSPRDAEGNGELGRGEELQHALAKVPWSSGSSTSSEERSGSTPVGASYGGDVASVL